MFRSVTLPEGISGQLKLHSMPGRYEDWDKFEAEISRRSIDTIVCLAPPEEIEKKSPSYVDAINRGTVPCARECFAIADYSVPDNRDAFAVFVNHVAQLLRDGKKILVHCGAGIGRTGTFSVCVLLALGLPEAEAKRTVHNAGSYPETLQQKSLIAWYLNKRQGATAV